MYTLGGDPEWKAAISYKLVEPDVLALEGMVDGQADPRPVPPDGRFPVPAHQPRLPLDQRVAAQPLSANAGFRH